MRLNNLIQGEAAITPGTVILRGIVGSTAYGLDTPDSDIDRLGVYAAPTRSFHGLHPPLGRAASRVTTHPDVTLHEAGKYVALALKANPTITELLWLPSHEVRDEHADALIGIRRSLLSASTVRNAYLGYATQQFRRLQNRGDGSFSSDTRKRTAKHARHLWRLLHQGTMLHRTGHLEVRLAPSEAMECRAFGATVAYHTDHAQRALAAAEDAFDWPGALPDRPDEAAAEGWLLRLRASHYQTA